MAAAAGVAAVAAYLDGKYHIRKDLGVIRRENMSIHAIEEMVKQDRCCLWYDFEDTVNRMPINDEAIWSRSGCYTWRQLYDQSCRYGAFLQSVGVQPRDLVATVMTNTPEFCFQWLGCWSIGAAPALINYHLTGEALVHCVRVSGGKVMIVDWDPEVVQRVEEVRGILEGELGIKIVILDEATRAAINALPVIRPDDSLRRGMEPTFPMCLIYTRYGVVEFCGCLQTNKLRAVDQQVIPKPYRLAQDEAQPCRAGE